MRIAKPKEKYDVPCENELSTHYNLVLNCPLSSSELSHSLFKFVYGSCWYILLDHNLTTLAT